MGSSQSTVFEEEKLLGRLLRSFHLPEAELIPLLREGFGQGLSPMARRGALSAPVDALPGSRSCAPLWRHNIRSWSLIDNCAAIDNATALGACLDALGPAARARPMELSQAAGVMACLGAVDCLELFERRGYLAPALGRRAMEHDALGSLCDPRCFQDPRLARLAMRALASAMAAGAQLGWDRKKPLESWLRAQLTLGSPSGEEGFLRSAIDKIAGSTRFNLPAQGKLDEEVSRAIRGYARAMAMTPPPLLISWLWDANRAGEGPPQRAACFLLRAGLVDLLRSEPDHAGARSVELHQCLDSLSASGADQAPPEIAGRHQAGLEALRLGSLIALGASGPLRPRI